MFHFEVDRLFNTACFVLAISESFGHASIGHLSQLSVPLRLGFSHLRLFSSRMVQLLTPNTGRVDNELTEACAALIAQLGKMKRVGMGWEDKAAFLELYRQKRK